MGAAAALGIAGSVFSGFGSRRSASKQNRRLLDLQRQRTAALDPSRIPGLLFGDDGKSGVFNALLKGAAPQFDELSRAGGTAQSGVATNIARRGLGGTGIGESLRNASQFIPGQLQFQGRGQVFSEALNSVLQLMQAQGGVPSANVGSVPDIFSILGQGGSDAGSILALLKLLGGNAETGDNPFASGGPFQDVNPSDLFRN